MSEKLPPVRVSVCIASYNYENYIVDAIESVFDQSIQDWELIIVDDASTDNSVSRIKSLFEKYPERCQLVQSPFNQGASYSFNQAFERASGEFIALLGADDRMLPQRLERQLAYFKANPDVAVVCSKVEVIDSNGQLQDVTGVFDRPISDIQWQLLSGNFLNAPSAMFRRDLLDKVGNYNEKLPYVQDLDHWLRITEQFPIVRIDEVLTQYRVHGNNVSLKSQNDMAFASIYETLFVILRAINKRAETTKNSHSDQAEITSLLMRYAQTAMQTELTLMGKFQWSLSLVYGLLLDIFAYDPDHVAATNLLNKLYQALGDNQRAIGERPISVAEYQAQQNVNNTLVTSDSDAQSLLDKIIAIREQTDLPLLTIAISMVDNKRGVFASEIEREQFLLESIQCVFRELTQDEQKPLLSSEKETLQTLVQLLKSDRFNVMKSIAELMSEEIAQWQKNNLYRQWINNHALQEIDAQIHAERMLSWSVKPQFHLFMFLFDGEQNLLADTIDSLGEQFYQNWKLTVIADGPAPDAMFDELAVLEWLSLSPQTEPYSFLHEAIINSSMDWIGFIPAGTRFEPQTWLQFGDYINLYQSKSAFYCDDDLINPAGERSQPRFKPDFNLDMLRSQDYIGIVICSKKMFDAVGGLDKVPGHENMSLAFKIYEHYGAEGLIHISDVLIHLPDNVQAHYSTDITKQTVQQHLLRQQVNAEVEDGLLDKSVRVVYQWPSSPKVSIIIPTKDKVEFLRPCVEAALHKNSYPDFEIIVINNQSEEQDTLEYFEQLSQLPQNKVRVIDYPHPFNYAAISNLASENAQGEYLLFLNNDTEALHAEWLVRMMSFAQRPEVGVVGARLVLPETGLIQHAGVILGMDTIADHPYLGVLDIKESGYMGRAQLDQNFSAVTGACLLVRKTLYQQVGGMDEDNFAISYNDIDLCLKIRDAGFLVTWTPYSVLVHHGSVTQKSELTRTIDQSGKVERFQKERKHMLKKWLPQIANDPAYNRHLSLAHRECLIESEMPTNWDTHFYDRAKVLGLPLKGGSGDYRIIQPFAALSHAAIAQCEYYRFSENHSRPVMLSEYARMAPDTVVFHAAINDIQLNQLEQLEEYLPKVFRIYTIDDLLTNVPEQSSAYREIKRHFADAKSRLRRALLSTNRLIVSTQPLADLCAAMIDDIRVIPNRLPKDTWLSLTSLKNQSSKPRVGWAGAQQHQGDLAIMTEVIKATAEEVDWIFMGMCPEDIKPYVSEYHHFVPIADYPAKLASLNLDLAVAPLEIHPFNEAKSNLRLLEYGVLGWPVICTDIYPYQTNNPPVVRVKNEVEAWVTAIRQVLADKAALADAGSALRAWVLQHYMLEDHLDEWLDALTKK